MNRRTHVVALFLALLFGAVSGLAQTTTSILEGKTLDSSGAALPGVSVDVKGATEERAVVSDAEGFYRVVALPAGTYVVRASFKGFKTQILEGITLALDRTATLDISGVFHATSGVYFSATGTPYDIDGDDIFETRPINTKRNQFLGPSTVDLDTRIEKQFRFRERFVVAPLVEFFNITNQANPKLINTFFTGCTGQCANGAPGPQFGQVLVPQPGREVQFGLRFQF